MRVVAVIAISILLVFVSREVFLFYGERNELTGELGAINAQIEEMEKENEKVEGDIRYFSHEDNLEKEARSELNYKASGEKLIIIVPGQ